MEAPAFVELPNGLFTSGGNWFHTSVGELTAFAAPVLERVSLERLIRDAESWLRLPDTLALWVFLGCLLAVSIPGALAIGLVVHAGAAVLSPGLVLRPAIGAARIMEHPVVVGVAYVAGLSWLGSGGGVVAVVVGLAWFVLVRWGLVRRVLGPVVAPLQKRLYRLGIPDEILRAVITRNALAFRVDVGDLSAMEHRMMEIANRHRKQENHV
jgi:hypothetical protein